MPLSNLIQYEDGANDFTKPYAKAMKLHFVGEEEIRKKLGAAGDGKNNPLANKGREDTNKFFGKLFDQMNQLN